ncbi:DUF397 domain-containing protein [Sphaerisporangium album]|uniref:DUF397 domain-containing protein n=1 Tax=Sphaerisporangium album TaxID=509200 RepID=A0A367F0P9_9ACTN|nr:DUF397 domain-containing protein [Sphaerisporangium album]RCG23948.1 DUF397 domain-containing protein [Sphaerisporangium album]
MPDQVELAGVSWRKSSFSGGGNDCVEIATINDTVALRDSKRPGGPLLRFSHREWNAFLDHLRAGDLVL